MFSVDNFQAAFDAALAKCQLLDRAQAKHFVDNGYVVVKAAFSERIASAVRAQAWQELKEKHDVEAQDPRTWGQRLHGRNGIPGYVRTAGSGRRFLLHREAPKAFQALADVIGGAQRLPANGTELAWGDGVVANLGVGENDDRIDKEIPTAKLRINRSLESARQPSWHKDGWHFRHFLDSPEQGLVVVPMYSDIRPNSGGTRIAADSIAPVARLLADNPQGLHADSVQGAGYLIPGLVEQCERFQELTGEVGDMAILHPFMLHRACLNPSPRPRFIANAALVLREPMQFNRQSNAAFSLVELAVLRALQVNQLSFAIEEPREALIPAPFRNEEDKSVQRRRLAQEMAAMADKGVVTPAWGETFGYMSNARSS